MSGAASEPTLSHDRVYSERYDRLAEKAIAVGWHLPVAMTEKLCGDLEEILDNDATIDPDEEIFRRIRGYCLHPSYMVRIVYIFYHKKEFRNHSYLVDEAVQTLYGGQYSASARASIAALEGALCNLTCHSKFNKNAVQHYFGESLMFKCLVSRGQAYARYFLKFCMDWIFINTDHPNAWTKLQRSGLNRHSMAHGRLLGRPLQERDALRALLACELLAEIERCRTREDHTVYPDEEHKEIFKSFVKNYDMDYCQLASRRDTRRALGLDSQSSGRPQEQPFGSFSHDFDACGLHDIPGRFPGVELVRRKFGR